MLKFSKKGLTMGIGTSQIIIILLIVLLLFGGKKIPELASGLGKGIKNFKDAVKEGEEEADVKKTEKIEEKPANKTESQKEKEVNA
jgi:sec-independent protein translocase protein TatA